MFKRLCAFLTASLLSACSHATTKVAIIDSGLNVAPKNVKVCGSGSYDFTLDQEGVGVDVVGHGTNIAKIVAEQAGKSDYCLVILKVFSFGPKPVSEDEDKPASEESVVLGNSGDTTRAILMAAALGVDVIVMALDGDGSDKTEHLSLQVAGIMGKKIFVAAGNESLNLDETCTRYPACYEKVENMTVVGTFKEDTQADHGAIVTSLQPYCHGSFCGTSASTAYAAGRYVRSRK